MAPINKKLSLIATLLLAFTLSVFSQNVNTLDFGATANIANYAWHADATALNCAASSSMTITAWVKTTATANQYFIVKRGSAENTIGYEIYMNAGGYLSMYLRAGATTGGGFYSIATNTPNSLTGTLYKINDGNWHHIAFVFIANTGSSTSSYSTYVDGKLEKTTTNAILNPAITNTQPFCIGARNSAGTISDGMTGQIDEVRIYTAALTQANLVTDMATQVISSTANLAAAWNMDEVSGNLLDIKSTNPLTIAGAPAKTTAPSLTTPTLTAVSKIVGNSDFKPTGVGINYGATFTTSDATKASIVSNQYHVLAAGTPTMTATQTANLFYAAGTPTATLTINAQGQTAIKFPGNVGAYAQVGSNALFDIPVSGNVTISCWHKAAVANELAQKFIISRAATITTKGYQIYQTSTGYLGTTIYTTAGTLVSIPTGATRKINDGNWHHIAIVFDNTNLTYSSYVDGQLEATKTILTADATSGIIPAATLFFGIQSGGAGGTGSTAYLDEVRFYNSAFNAAAVATDMITTVTSGTANLKAAWRFEEGNYELGTTVAEVKGVLTGSIQRNSTTTPTSSITVTPVITFGAIPNKSVGDADFAPTISAASGTQTFVYSSSNTAVATIVNNQIHVVGTGVSTITATQVTYAGGSASQTLTVPGPQTITFNAIPTKDMLTADFAPGATTTSGLPISYTSLNTDVATITAGNLIHIVGSGTADIVANQAGDAAITAATPVTVTLNVIKVAQTITFPAIPLKRVGYTTFDPRATVSSPLAVTITSSNDAVASIVGGQVQINGAGTCTIYANQAGNATYAAATQVSQPLSVTGVVVAPVVSTLAAPVYYSIESANSAAGYTGNLMYAPTSTSGVLLMQNTATAITAIPLSLDNAYWAIVNDAGVLKLKNKGTGLFLNTSSSANTTPTTDFLYVAYSSNPLQYNIKNSGNSYTLAYTSNSINKNSGDLGVNSGIAWYFVLDPSATNVPQIITFPAIAAKLVGDASFAPGATSTSTLAVTYTSSDDAVASIVGGQVQINGAGTCTIYANQAGNATYTAATQVSHTLDVATTAAGLTLMSTINTTTTLITTGTKAGINPGQYTTTSRTTFQAAIDAATVVKNNGAATDQNKTDATATLDAAKASYLASKNAITISTTGNETWYYLKGTRGSTTTALFAQDMGGALQTLDKDQSAIDAQYWKVVANGAGKALVNRLSGAYMDADLATGNNLGTKATIPTKPLVVTTMSQESTSGNDYFMIEDIYNGATTFRLHAGGSGNNWGLMNYTGGRVNYITNVDPTYLFQFITVTNAANVITFGSLSSKAHGAADFTLNATASSTLPVSYVSSDPTVATVDASTGLVHILKVGTTTITASQAGNVNFAAATSVEQVLTVTPSASTISSNTNLSASGLTDTQLANTNLTISSGEFVIDAAKTVQSLTVAPGAKLTLSSGSITATNGIILQSDATGTATFVDNNTNSPQAVSATVQQYLPQGRNWYMCSPITAATTAALSTATTVQYWNEPTGAWVVATGGSSLTNTKGYISVGTSSTGTVAFSGTLNTGSKSIALTRTTGVTKEGFNLVGNPYPSYLVWTEALAISANALSTIWYRTKPTTSYDFYTYNATGGVGTPSTVTSYIPPMQAFWVRANVGGGTLVFNNTMREHANSPSNLLKAPAAKNSQAQLLRLNLSNGESTNETVLYSASGASNAFDAYDSPKMWNAKAVSELYTQVGTDSLVINGMNVIPLDIEIPLGLKTESSTTLSLKATELTNLAPGVKLMVKDKLYPAEFDLTNGEVFNFTSAAVTGTDRFSLILKSPSATTNLATANQLNVLAYGNAQHQLVVQFNNPSATTAVMTVFNALGQKTLEKQINTSVKQTTESMTPGVYMVSLTVNGVKVTRKVVVR